jgi:hypothetical protein
MFKPMNQPPSEPVEQTPTFIPKPVSQEDTAAILATIMAENPTFADTERNGELIAQFLVKNHCEFTLENCRKAVQILSYPFDKLDRAEATSATTTAATGCCGIPIRFQHAVRYRRTPTRHTRVADTMIDVL